MGSGAVREVRNAGLELLLRTVRAEAMAGKVPAVPVAQACQLLLVAVQPALATQYKSERLKARGGDGTAGSRQRAAGPANCQRSSSVHTIFRLPNYTHI